jgi:hypothetical protein
MRCDEVTEAGPVATLSQPLAKPPQCSEKGHSNRIVARTRAETPGCAPMIGRSERRRWRFAEPWALRGQAQFVFRVRQMITPMIRAMITTALNPVRSVSTASMLFLSQTSDKAF